MKAILINTSLVVFTLFICVKPTNAFNLKGSYNDTGIAFTQPIPPHQLSQSFTASHNNLSAIEVMLKSSGTQSIGQLQLTLFKLDGTPIATSSSQISLSNQKAFHTFTFPQVQNSAQQVFTFSLVFLPQESSDPIVVNKSTYNAYQSGNFSLDEQIKNQDLVFRTYYQRPSSFLVLVTRSIYVKIKSELTFFGVYLLILIAIFIRLIKIKQNE